MIFHLEDMNRSNCDLRPGPCRGCSWWQGHESAWPAAAAEDRWQRNAESQSGSWGKLALGDGRFLGQIQYGPATLFPRCQQIPGGPLTRGAWLLACGLVADESQAPALRSLVLAMIADLEMKGVSRVEAWGREGTGDGDCHHLGTDFLGSLGFSPVRRSRKLVLMGLDLKTLQRVHPMPLRRRRLLDRIRRTAPEPTPLFSIALRGVSRTDAQSPCERNVLFRYQTIRT